MPEIHLNIPKVDHFRKLILLILIFACSKASALTAGFTASTTSGCPPLLVSFTNTTVPMTGTTFSWTFGASSGTSTLTNPSVYFTTSGTHVVTLTATNGGVTSTYTMSITVHPQPTVNFTTSDTTVCPNTPITFTSTTLGGVAGTVTCTWNWGDGSSATGSPATHSYATPGDYTVSLFATNSMGCQSSLVKPAHVHVSVPPHAAFTSTGGCNPPVTVSFTSTSAVSVPPATYSWTFGDGGTGAGAPTSHLYTSVSPGGGYPAKLIVTDGNGCVDSVTVPVIVATMSPSFTGPDSVCVFSTATFTSTGTPFSSCLWNFGDGGTSSANPGSHAWSAPGTYIVTLTTRSPSPL
jgi:PKD repeat protein